jgi:hypothetical protein
MGAMLRGSASTAPGGLVDALRLSTLRIEN